MRDGFRESMKYRREGYERKKKRTNSKRDSVCMWDRERQGDKEWVCNCVCMLCVWCTCIVGHVVYAVSDVSQPFRAVINAIESRHVRCDVIRWEEEEEVNEVKEEEEVKVEVKEEEEEVEGK